MSLATLLPLLVLMTNTAPPPGNRAPIPKDFADLYNAIGTPERLTIAGRIIRNDDDFKPLDVTPLKDISQDEIDDAQVVVSLMNSAGKSIRLGPVQADDEGYIKHTWPLAHHKVTAGQYTLRVTTPDGAYMGSSSVRILTANDIDFVVRSDVDMTYLMTQFHTKRALIKLMKQPASERTTLPGMPGVYRALRAGKHNKSNRPLTFLSGSPLFFKRTLENKMRIDRVTQDGLVLKPMKDLALHNLLRLNIDKILGSLKSQLGYKMASLLALRLDIPSATSEILMGDDTEADIVAYVLYYQFTSQALTKTEFLAKLKEHGVSSYWLNKIKALAVRVRKHVQTKTPVRAIYIRKTAHPSPNIPVTQWALPGLVRYHTGTWSLILDLYEQGWVSLNAIADTRVTLMNAGHSAQQLSEAALDAVKQGFLSAETYKKFER